jgi:hypothetical protein
MEIQVVVEVNEMTNKIGWKLGAVLAVVALLMVSAAPAEARSLRRHSGFRSSFGITIGPLWYPWFWVPPVYPDPYSYPDRYPYRYPDRYYDRYYEPPPVVTPPRVYEQQVPAPQDQGGQTSWYSCQDPPGYYPYVSQCPGGWTKTPSSPDTAPPAAKPQAPRTPEEAGPVPEEYRWYHCEDPPGYYPYVQECPGGWTKVPPAPAR